jgi:hypothetical protein
MHVNGLPESVDISLPPVADSEEPQLSQERAAIAKFRKKALDDDDPELVVLGLVESHLLDIETQVKQHYDDIPRAGAECWEDVQAMQKESLGMHQPLVHQIKQIHELRTELKEKNERASRRTRAEASEDEVAESEPLPTEEPIKMIS